MFGKARETANTFINNLGNVDPNADLPSYREQTQTSNVVNFKKFDQLIRDVDRYDTHHESLLKQKYDDEIKYKRNMERLVEKIDEAARDLSTVEDVLIQRVEEALKHRYDVQISRKPPPSPADLDVSFEDTYRQTMPEGE